jgi:hypothetical protein
MVGMWAALFALLKSDQLDEVATWIRNLPLIVELALWLLLFPWVLATAVWTTEWSEALRVTLVVIFAAGWAIVSIPRPKPTLLAGGRGGPGVAADGRREVLGFDVGDSEDGAFWTAFLRSLKTRGLHGVQLVISDAHAGLKAAIEAVLLGAAWQRYRVHFLRNVLAQAPKATPVSHRKKSWSSPRQ